MNDNDLSFIIGSTRRQDVLLALAQKKMTVGEVADKIDVKPIVLYKTFRELTEKGFITHNDVRRFKIYRITDKGLELLTSIGVIK